MTQIKKSHIDFMSEATRAFAGNIIQETFKNDKKFPGFMALRMGFDRDCVEVYEDGERVANFVQVMEPKPYPEEHLLQLMFDSKSMMKKRPDLMKFNSEAGLLYSLVAQAKEIESVSRHGNAEDRKRLPALCAVATYILACIHDRCEK